MKTWKRIRKKCQRKNCMGVEVGDRRQQRNLKRRQKRVGGFHLRPQQVKFS